MQMFDFFRQLAIEPVQLSIREKWITALACVTAILLTAAVTRITAQHSVILLASMGASAAILFTIPSSPLAQPWPFLGGHMLSGTAGIMAAAYVPDPVLAAGAAIGMSMLGMLLMRCLHPPGAATTLVPVLNHSPVDGPDFDFLLQPLGINVALMLLLCVAINRILLRRAYPARINLSLGQDTNRVFDNNLVGISPADIEQAMRGYQQFIDIGAADLREIFTLLQLQHFRNHHPVATCGDIMHTDIVTVEYATEVEHAWLQMHTQNLKALPVLDRARRVIGIVTKFDFFKNVKLTPYAKFEQTWQAFVKATPANTTHKPEAVGHIMTRKVKTLSAKAPISDLMPLIVDEGHHCVPIVDDEQRFVGMVFQSSAIGALFNREVFQTIVKTDNADTPHFISQ